MGSDRGCGAVGDPGSSSRGGRGIPWLQGAGTSLLGAEDLVHQRLVEIGEQVHRGCVVRVVVVVVVTR